VSTTSQFAGHRQKFLRSFPNAVHIENALKSKVWLKSGGYLEY
jgi:hypothetical protein